MGLKWSGPRRESDSSIALGIGMLIGLAFWLGVIALCLVIA